MIKYFLLLFLFLSTYVFSQYDLKKLSTDYKKIIINDNFFLKNDSVIINEIFVYLDENPDLIEEVLFINSKDLHSNKLVNTLKIKYSPKEKVYKSIGIETNAKIDLNSIKCLYTLDFKCYQDFLNNRFKTINGKNTVYHFIASYKGESFTGEFKDFHDLLVIEIDQKTKKIINGYHLTKEWAELPLGSDLYKINANDIILVDSLPISLLKLSHEEYKNLLEDNGYIKLNH